MTDPIACPLYAPRTENGNQYPAEFVPCPELELEPLLRFLSTRERPEKTLSFPRGTLSTDGRLDLCKQNLGPAGCQRVTDAIGNHPHVRYLLLGTNGIGDEGAHHVAEAIRSGLELEIVYLGCNRITSEGAKNLASILQQQSSVDGLWLKRNPIGDEGVWRIVNALQYNSTLRVLDLVNTGLTLKSVLFLVQVLMQENRTVECLYLGGNQLTAASASPLAELIRESVHLKSLFLNVNQLGDEGAVAIAKGLKINRGLCDLGIGSNGMTDTGTALIFDAVIEHPSLRYLDLSFSPSTRVLNAAGNRLGRTGVAAAASLLKVNRTLQVLNLAGTGIDNDGRKLLYDALEWNSTLCELNMDGPVPPTIRSRLLENQRHQPQFFDRKQHLAKIKSVYR